ncbi:MULTISPECIES: aspartate aminotransferase family protein [unclassified Microbacterium]|uniref:aspartate aminotransferase family protein n=1 Tax=unclassified Microbacterium TaxID=2609290 RepID=UPI00214D02C8|nr:MULTISPECIES: aspartate aminotransferase family protein [unclassified Microbacterium]MCR2808778.1 aspartate aminotransferase family protein [Microbacterium sp. zg.B185]WIM18797.1 aspartate aminotransferase family protein [Microbacterium sp. zg-B185]
MTTTSATDLDETTKRLDREHVFHSWSAQAALDPMVIAGGEGTVVWDHAGNRYLDFSSQLVNVNIGHQHPAVVRAIQEQAAVLSTIGPATANLTRGQAAQRILARAGAPFSKVFFTNGGADAIENAIRMARLHTGRDKVLSTYRSYHGNTGAAIVSTGDWRRIPNEYARGHVHFFGPYLYRSEFWSDSPEQESVRALHHLERVIQSEGAAGIAAILLESVPGTAGILIPPPGYLAGVRALADKYGIVLILDEVMAGFGRTGRWFAFQGHDVVPDLIAFAKGVNSGYVPVGGVAISAEIAATFDERVFPGGLTYSGHPLAAASIIGALDAMEDEGIVENARRVGADAIGPALAQLQERHPLIGEVRGEGVFWAIELVADRATREPVGADVIGRLKKELVSRGLLPFSAENRIHVVPPCVVTDDEVGQAMSIYDEALTVLESA